MTYADGSVAKPPENLLRPRRRAWSAKSELGEVNRLQTVLGAMVMVAFQKSLPVLGSDGFARGIEEIERALDHGENDGVLLADHARGVSGTGDFKDDVTRFRDPALIVGPGALYGIDDYGSRVEMHLQGRARLRTDEQNNLAGDGIQLDQLDEMSIGPRDPGQILRFGVAGERLMYGMGPGSIVH